MCIKWWDMFDVCLPAREQCCLSHMWGDLSDLITELPREARGILISLDTGPRAEWHKQHWENEVYSKRDTEVWLWSHSGGSRHGAGTGIGAVTELPQALWHTRWVNGDHDFMVRRKSSSKCVFICQFPFFCPRPPRQFWKFQHVPKMLPWQFLLSIERISTYCFNNVFKYLHFCNSGCVHASICIYMYILHMHICKYSSIYPRGKDFLKDRTFNFSNKNN